MPRPRNIALAGLGAVAGAALAVRQVERRWEAAPDDILPEHRELPRGESLTVPTDDGAELAVTVAGDGPDVVLAHCWTGARAVWAPVAHRLVDAGRRVTLYDQRGHGESSCGDDGYTIPRLGADLRAVMSHVDASDAVVAGHSMGGMTIMALATHHPEVLAERARAVVLVSTAATGLSPRAGDRVAGRVVASPVVERAMRSRLGHLLVRGSVGATVRRHHVTLTRDLFVDCPAEARRALLAAMLGMDLREALAGIDLPTTVVVGTHDRLTPPTLAQTLVDAIPGAELETLDRHGHMLPLEAPDDLATVIAKAG